jgi:heme A synthase
MPGAARRGWSIFLFIIVILLVIAGVILLNYQAKFATGTCPSLFQAMTGQESTGQALGDDLTNGQCTNDLTSYLGAIVVMAIFLVILLIIAIPLAISGSVARGRFMRASIASGHGVAAGYPMSGVPASAPSSNVAPSGWYVDPSHPGMQRYWNGVTWTEDYRPTA